MPGRDVDIGYAEWGPEEKERLNAALQSSAVRDIAPTLGIVVVAIGITYFYLNSQINHWLFDVWALVSILVQVFRFGCMTRIARHPITKRSYNIVMLCQVLGGSVWAALLFFWNNEMSLGMQLMFVLAPIGLCLGSVTSAGAWPPFSIAIIVSSKLPFFLYHMVAQPAGLLTVAVPMLVFTVLDLTLLRNYHLRARESFELRIRNERLININGVIGGADMLSRTAMDSSQRQWLETIRSSSGDMLRLVDQLLDHSSMNEGRFSLQNRVFNLANRSITQRPASTFTSLIAYRPSSWLITNG